MLVWPEDNIQALHRKRCTPEVTRGMSRHGKHLSACGFLNKRGYQVSLSQGLYIPDASSCTPPTHTATCVGMGCQAGVSLTAAVTM